MGVLYREIPGGFLDMKCQTCFFYSEYLARIISKIGSYADYNSPRLCVCQVYSSRYAC